jgi:DeoR/GlpR family transcriptional regulator of sugar metabolism
VRAWSRTSSDDPVVNTARERRDLIARLIEEQERVSVADLTQRFGVTDTSIRRDLRLLEEEGRLKRMHGGAIATRRSPRSGVYRAKERQHLDQKRRIGAAAAALVTPGDVVLFDSGTTVAQASAQVAPALRLGGAITAVTHSLPVIEELGSWPEPHLVCLGGLFFPNYQAFAGPQTLSHLRDLSADIVFLGCDGLTIEQGVTTQHVLIAEVGAMMASHARRVIALADSSKLNRSGFTPIIPVAAVDLLITDDAADEGYVTRIREAGCEVLIT